MQLVILVGILETKKKYVLQSTVSKNGSLKALSEKGLSKENVSLK